MGTVVVGVDESEPAQAALRWAVEEGRRRGWAVRAVLGWSYLDQHEDQRDGSFRPDYTEQDAIAVLDRLVDAAVPGEDVERAAVLDLPARALLEAAADADLLVVGARGLGGVQGAVLGSVSQQVVHHSTVPVAVVRPSTAPAGERVVVGVDGSANSLRAVAWALDEARARQAPVTVVHAVKRSPFAVGKQPRQAKGADVADMALQGVDTAGLDVDTVVADENPAKALLEASRDAALVVVGSRGHGGFASLLLGSVSQHVLNHATCPVVVVPPASRAAH